MTAIDVHHRVEGPSDAPVIVLSNSLGTDLRVWEPQAPELSERFRVVRYDHRGHGRSPVPAGPYTMADLAGDVIALLDRLGVERASFCGVSMGGMVGMALATAAPERVDRLVLCCTSAHMPPPELWDERIASVTAHGTAAMVDGTIARWFTESFRATDPPAVALARDMIGSTPAAGYAACCAAIRDMDQRATIGAITSPTLVIAGEHDPATPPEHGELIRDRIAGSSMEVIPAASHLAVLERPEAVRAAIRSHMTKAQI
ncbi:MAG: 3-oxoadipate enol-lactonase [Acidimicrobiales bacterium]